ncbi:MAG TPA: hypothetical protein VNR38_03850 [Ureibacillus sp.]|nr:hypothetical protein [Ureibacillus sp.]
MSILIKSILIYFLASIIGFFLADYFSWPKWIVLIFMFIAFVYMLCEMLNIMYGTKDMKKVERFLKSKLKEPIYAFVYAQAIKSKDEQLRIIEEILKKYPQKYIHHNYRFVRDMLNNDYLNALNEAEQIGKEPFMSYSKALVFATQNNREQALSFHLSKLWMREAIHATLAKAEENHNDYIKHKEKAIEAARGIQRFGLIHSL